MSSSAAHAPARAALLARRLLAKALLVAGLAVLALPLGAQDAPQVTAPAEAWLTYRVDREVSEGAGAYEGYGDSLQAAGQYDLSTVSGVSSGAERIERPSLRIAASYDWVYRGERCEEGRVERIAFAGLSDRLYLGQTDLDDYDAQVGTTPLATWVWIPPETPIGATVRVLERDFVVVGSESVSVASRPVTALHLQTSGAGTRDDEYGSFQTTFTDSYWFDAASGYFLRSEYRERDSGSFDGSPASFTWTERAEVTSASFLPGTVPPSDTDLVDCAAAQGAGTGTYSGGASGVDPGACCFCFGLLFVGLVFVIVTTLRSRRRPVLVQGQSITVRPIVSAADVPALDLADSPHFAPFLRHLAECAVRAHEPVFVARLADGKPVGLALADREANIGSIFAREPDVCEALRQAIGVTEFFTETRHDTLPSVVEAAQAAGRAQLPLAYNVYETYEILELRGPRAVPYDAALVSRMTEADLPEVATLSAKVHGVRGERWLGAVLGAGDLGFCARIDGKLVGYAFATVVGDQGRIHSSAVDPDHRGRGLGKELARARLTACAALGVTRVLTEVATWNLASLEVVRSLGFHRMGEMWVESAASARVERKVVRR